MNYLDALKGRSKDFIDGFKQGVTTFAWWKDGSQYVGTCGTLLRDILAGLPESTVEEKLADAYLEAALNPAPPVPPVDIDQAEYDATVTKQQLQIRLSAFPLEAMHMSMRATGVIRYCDIVIELCKRLRARDTQVMEIRKLNRIHPEYEWSKLIEHVCDTVLKEIYVEETQVQQPNEGNGTATNDQGT